MASQHFGIDKQQTIDRLKHCGNFLSFHAARTLDRAGNAALRAAAPLPWDENVARDDDSDEGGFAPNYHDAVREDDAASNRAIEGPDDEELFDEDGASEVDTDDEAWTEVTDEASKINAPEPWHISELDAFEQAARTLQVHAKDAGLHLKDKALEAAIEAAGLAAYILQDQACMVAEDTGWLTNCDAVDEFVRRVMLRYPVLGKTKRVTATIKEAFIKGRTDAAAGRLRREVAAQSLMDATRSMQGQGRLVMPSRPIDRERFAGGEGQFEHVPLADEEENEGDLDLVESEEI